MSAKTWNRLGAEDIKGRRETLRLSMGLDSQWAGVGGNETLPSSVRLSKALMP